MFFTKDDYKKIADYLSHNLVRDTDFSIASTIENEDLIPIVQDGKNKTIKFSDLMINILQGSDMDNKLSLAVYNLGDITNQEFSTAINNIPQTNRKPGLIITFYSSSKGWHINQFQGTTDTEVRNSWTDISKWTDIHKELRSAITEVISNIEGLERRVGVLENGSTTPDVGEDTSAIVTKVNTIETKVNTLETETGTLKQDLSTLETNVNNITSSKGQVNGIATLNDSGKVPAEQLPSYVDDVLEFNSKTSFPTKGEGGKIYVAADTNQVYRWSGSTYIEVSFNEHIVDKDIVDIGTFETINQVSNYLEREDVINSGGIFTFKYVDGDYIGNGYVMQNKDIGPYLCQIMYYTNIVKVRTFDGATWTKWGNRYKLSYNNTNRKLELILGDGEESNTLSPNESTILPLADGTNAGLSTENFTTTLKNKLESLGNGESGSSIVLGEVAGTAFPGDRGKVLEQNITDINNKLSYSIIDIGTFESFDEVSKQLEKEIDVSTPRIALFAFDGVTGYAITFKSYNDARQIVFKGREYAIYRDYQIMPDLHMGWTNWTDWWYSGVYNPYEKEITFTTPLYEGSIKIPVANSATSGDTPAKTAGLTHNNYSDADKAKVDRIGDNVWLRYNGNTLDVSNTGNNDYKSLALKNDIKNNPLPTIVDTVSIPFEELNDSGFITSNFDICYNRTLGTFVAKSKPGGSGNPSYYSKFLDYALYGTYVNNKGVVPYKYGLYFNTTYNTLYRWNAEESTLENFKLDNRVPHLQEQIDRKADKEDLFIDLWNAACGSYGRYNPGTGKFELNGLTDITYEEAIKIYNASNSPWVTLAYTGKDFRTNIYPYGNFGPSFAPGEDSINRWPESVFGNSGIEVARVTPDNTSYRWKSIHRTTFYNCKNLKKVIGVLEDSPEYIGDILFNGCVNLQEVSFYGVCHNVNLADSPNISFDTLDSIVTTRGEAPVSITVTVHSDVYDKMVNPDNPDYASWNMLYNIALGERNVEFMSAV